MVTMFIVEGSDACKDCVVVAEVGSSLVSVGVRSIVAVVGMWFGTW
jgi:hypothetical protein